MGEMRGDRRRLGRALLGALLASAGLAGLAGRGGVAVAVDPRDVIAYVSEAPGGGSAIFAATVDGAVTTQLTAGVDDRRPTWAPDGTAIAFERRSGDTSSVLVARLDDRSAEPLAEAAAWPAWSSAGDRIAVHALDDDGDVVGLDLIPLSQGDASRILTGEVGAVAWSADGTSLAAQTANGLARWSADGGVAVLAPGAADAAFGYAPDGTRVAFVESKSSPGLGVTTSLVVQDVDDATDRIELDTGTSLLGSRVTSIVWSPDGSQLAWSTLTADGSAVYSVPVDGSGQMATATESAGNVLTVDGWSPDARSLLVTIGPMGVAEPPVDPAEVSLQLGVVDPDGANLSWLLFGAQPAMAPAGTIVVEGPAPSLPASASPAATAAPTPVAAPTPAPTVTPSPSGPTPTPVPPPTQRPTQTTAPAPTPAPTPTLPPRARSDFLVRSIPPPTEISVDPVVVATSAATATGVLLLIPFPSQLFNSTLDQNRERIAAGLARSRRRVRSGSGRLERFWRTPLGFIAFIGIAALLGALLDPRLGLDARSIATFLGMGLGIAAVAVAFALPKLLARRRRGRPAGFRVLPASLVVSAACVIVSRVMGLVPGYLYGAILGVEDDDAGDADAEEKRREEGRSTAIGAAWSLALALLAWVVSWPLTADVGSDIGLAVLVVRTALWAMVVAGIESVVFGFLPVRFLPGEKVFRWSKRAWALLLGIALFAFLHVLVNPASGYLTDEHRVPFATAMAALALFGGGSVAFWAWFRLRPAPAAPPAPAATTSGDRSDP